MTPDSLKYVLSHSISKVGGEGHFEPSTREEADLFKALGDKPFPTVVGMNRTEPLRQSLSEQMKSRSSRGESPKR